MIRGRFLLVVFAPLLLVIELSAACSQDETSPATSADSGASADVTVDIAVTDTVDSAPPRVCVEGRRRCVERDLEICRENGWTLLDSCFAGETCDVAVGICRPGDAGARDGD